MRSESPAMPLDGRTKIIAHIGYPTESFKAPLIYNPYFTSLGINAAVVPMGVGTEHLGTALPVIFNFSNTHGALITMPHKMSVVGLLDEVSSAVRISGACNAVLKRADGKLVGDMFDGEGFVRGMLRKGRTVKGKSALIVGSGGVGSAIAASLAANGLGRISLFDIDQPLTDGLAARLAQHYPKLSIRVDSADPSGHDIVVNATPLGMNRDDAMPVNVDRIAPEAFVGEVVMAENMTAFLTAAQASGCQVQVGLDMLFEQIPAYLEFFGFPSTTPENLRTLMQEGA